MAILINCKSIIYLAVAVFSLFCFINSLIESYQSFIPSLEFYTTLGCFLYFIYAFYLEISCLAFSHTTKYSNFIAYFVNFVFSYKFLFCILIASFLQYIIFFTLLQEKSSFSGNTLTSITLIGTRVVLPLFNVFYVICYITKCRITTRMDITIMFIIFMIFGGINLLLRALIFNKNSSFGSLFNLSLGEALLCLVFSISGIPLHDYFLKYRSATEPLL